MKSRKLRLYFHSVRYLKVVQIFWKLYLSVTSLIISRFPFLALIRYGNRFNPDRLQEAIPFQGREKLLDEPFPEDILRPHRHRAGLLLDDTFEDFRHDYITRVIRPAIEESLKATTAKFTAEELITQRPEVKRMLDIELGDRLENIQGKQYFIFVQASLTDFQFSESFTDAIENKVTQQQRALEAENKLRQIEAEAQQQVIQAKAEKEAAIARAEGEARAIYLRAMAEANATRVQAEAQSYQIQLINQMIADNPFYIQYEWIKAWDGRLPSTVFGDENIELLLQGYAQGSELPP